MKSIRFRKYSLNGNTFVFIDETAGRDLNEDELSRFAFQATNSYFGIGADNLIILQACTAEVLAAVNEARGYWEAPPAAGTADFIFRMFEPDGTEAYSCGNGLTCIADHLHLQLGLQRSRIMTQVPLETPQVLTVGWDAASGMNWANLGAVRTVPPFMVHAPTEAVGRGDLARIRNLKVCFSDTHPEHPTQAAPLDITGYLVFTGEPHLVLLTQDGFPDRRIAAALFAEHNGRSPGEALRGSYNSWLVHYIGTYLNRTLASLFPCGINVNFVRLVEPRGTIEYRCFERGIDHETLACGTGAVAASAVVRELGLADGDDFHIHPHRCRWYHPRAAFIVRRRAGDWHLYGRPDLLYEGTFPFGRADIGGAIPPPPEPPPAPQPCNPETRSGISP